MIALGGLGILIAIAIVIAIAIGIYYALKSPLPSANTFDGPFSLAKRATAVAASDFTTSVDATMYVTSGAATFQAFVYPDTLAQTAKAAGCGRGANSPSCESGLFAACQCGSDCTNCSHEGYRNLINLYGVYAVEVLNIPDASRQNAVAAQLTVVTNDSTAKFVETIPLPPLPLQRWTMLTICHTGRQLNVYYNSNLVSSAKTERQIMTRANSVNYIEVGDAGLTGSVGLLRILKGCLTSAQVGSVYASLADTRGAPTAVLTTPSAYGAAVQRLDSGSLLSRLFPSSGANITMPSLSMPSMPSLGSTDKSISTLYGFDSPYA